MRDFWSGKKILLTGHTGFKGAWLTLVLHHFGARVYGYALPPEPKSLFETLAFADCLASEKHADIADAGALESFYRETAPDITIHMAAQALVISSYADPIETYRVNVIGTATILDVIRRVAIPQTVIIVTTDKVYQNHETGQSYAETDPLDGGDPYSASKACAEIVTASYIHSFLGGKNIAVKSARAGNVIGAGDWAENRLVPDFIRATLAGIDITVRHPQSVRPWQHVLEPLSGYLQLAQGAAAVRHDSFNFGPSRASCRPVREIVERLSTLWGRKGTPQETGADQPPEAGLLHLDSTRAHRDLGWQPRWSLDEALAATVKGYRALIEMPPAQARELFIAQIESYFQKS